jgi:hypothetical protein
LRNKEENMKLFQLVLMLVIGLMPSFVLQAATSSESPALAAGAPCLKEQWPKARTLVWTKPGESGTALVVGNWTEFASTEDYAAGTRGRHIAGVVRETFWTVFRNVA